jgi:hypothetical protein
VSHRSCVVPPPVYFCHAHKPKLAQARASALVHGGGQLELALPSLSLERRQLRLRGYQLLLNESLQQYVT